MFIYMLIKVFVKILSAPDGYHRLVTSPEIESAVNFDSSRFKDYMELGNGSDTVIRRQAVSRQQSTDRLFLG